MISAVIFDMDGTLFDTEVLYGEGWMKAGLSSEQYHQLIGRSKAINDAAVISFGFDPKEVRKIRNEYVQGVLAERGIPIKPWAKEVLLYFKQKKVPMALATSSPLSLAQHYMRESGFDVYMDVVLSGHALENGKPAPDIFFLAARQLGVEPASCLVVEDSFNGVRAGKNAGMVTVMIPDLILPDEEIASLADAVLPSLEALPSWVEAYNHGEEENR